MLRRLLFAFLLPLFVLGSSPSSFFLSHSPHFFFDPNPEITSEDAFSFLSSAFTSSERLDYGPISLSLMNGAPRYHLFVLTDAPMGSLHGLNQKGFSAFALDAPVCEFPSFFAAHLKASHFHLLSPEILSGDSIEDLAAALDVTYDVDTSSLSHNGITFAWSDAADRAFLADLALLLDAPARMVHSHRSTGHTTHVHAHGNAHLFAVPMASSRDLSGPKKAAANELILRAIEAATAQGTELTKGMLAVEVIATDMAGECPSLTPQPVEAEPQVEGLTLISPSNALLNDLASRPMPAAKGKKANETTRDPVMFNLGLWTAVMLIGSLGAVTYIMWTMKVYEDPLVFFTGFVFTEDEEPDL